jgi:hypothetical protein
MCAVPDAAVGLQRFDANVTLSHFSAAMLQHFAAKA